MNTKFKVKDLVLTAAMALCSILIFWICGVTGLSPYTLLALAPMWALLGGITFYMVAAKTKSPYMMFVFCFIQGFNGLSLLSFLAGILSGMVIMLLCRKGACENMRLLRVCYIIFTAAFACSNVIIPFMFFADQTVANYAQSVGESYMNIVKSLASVPVLLVLLVVVIVAAFFGGAIAQKLLKKHFKKAGTV